MGAIIKRIAFTLIGGRFWTGGYNYLFNLCRTLDAYVAERVKPVLFVGEDVPMEDLIVFRELRNVEVVRSSVFDAKFVNRRLAQAFLYGIDRAAARLFGEHRIDVVFEPAAYYGWRFPFAAIAWMPDFQHRTLPDLFDSQTYWKRELRCRTQVASGRYMLLSSEDAKRDCEAFYPASVGRTAVVRFAVLPDLSASAADLAAVVKKYELPEKFYYLPNQFWRHKNHAVVIKALAELKKRGQSLVVAVSGKQDDPYHPEHYATIEALIEAMAVEEEFRILGMIPHEDVIALMRTCSALINPSLCEGWSTTVEEAKSLGVPMLLSDLPVHREQVGRNARFFDPHAVEQLADLMEAYQGVPVSVRREAEISSAAAAERRVRQFAQDFADTVERRFGAWKLS